MVERSFNHLSKEIFYDAMQQMGNLKADAMITTSDYVVKEMNMTADKTKQGADRLKSRLQ